MLIFAPQSDGYPDDTDAGLRWRLPTALAPLPGPDGVPQVMLGRGDGGGVLHLRLQAVWPALRAGEKPAPIESGRFRLRLTTPAAAETGQWWPTPIAADALIDRSLSLGPTEAAIARHLGEHGRDLVEVELELTLRGLAPAYAWIASVATASLCPRLAALLGDAPAAPVNWPAVEAAFLGLNDSDFDWFPTLAGAIRPPRDEALRAIAHHAAALLLTATPQGYTLNDAPPPTLAINLAVPRPQTQRIGLRWSFSEFLAAAPDPARHLLDLTAAAPFDATPLLLVNDLPLAEAGIRSVTVEIRSGGPSGLLQHRFLPGQPAAMRLTYVKASFDAQAPSWRTRCTVSTPDGPAVVESDFRQGGALIEVDSASTGLRALRFKAAPEVFEHAAGLEIGLGTRTLALTPAAPEAWGVGRQPPASVKLAALARDGARVALGVAALGPQGLDVGGAALGIGEVVSVTLRPPADLAQRAAYLALQVEGHGWRTLEPGHAIAWPVRRASRLQPPRLRYRTRHVPRGANGATQVMRQSDWHDAAGEQIDVEI